MPSHTKTYKGNDLIDSYLKKVMASSEIDRENCEARLQVLTVFELVDIYLEYSNIKYVDKPNLKVLLEVLSEVIICKLRTLSLIKVIDLYILLFNKMLLVEDTLLASKNLLSIMNFELSNDEMIAKELKKRNITKEKYVLNCKTELETYTASISLNEECYTYIVTLQNKILSYIEDKITIIAGQEAKYLLENLTARFELTSKKLLEINECITTKTKLIKYNIDDVLDYNNLKNKLVVYDSFRTSLLNKKANS